MNEKIGETETTTVTGDEYRVKKCIKLYELKHMIETKIQNCMLTQQMGNFSSHNVEIILNVWIWTGELEKKRQWPRQAANGENDFD